MGVCVSKTDVSSTAVLKIDKSKTTVLNRMQDVKDMYTFDRILGQGHFGIARLVIEKATGAKYACKSISKRKFAGNDDIEDVRREIQIMHHLAGHPHVVGFKAAYEDKQHIHLVMELCQGGELFDSIVQRKFYSERDAAAVMRQMIGVVAHCHSMGVIHRDLKPENFLLVSTGQPQVIKATDFGLSAWLKDGQELHDMVGSPFYIAPEVLHKSYDQAADIWSCGVIMYTLLCGWPPFYGDTTQAIFYAIQHGTLDLVSDPWGRISHAAKDCVQSMLVRDPTKRATAADILKHEWLVENGAAPDEPLQVEVLGRMKKFSRMNKFKREAVKVMVGTLPHEELVGMRQVFSAMDRDQSGQITVEELREGLRLRGADLASTEIQKLLQVMDMDGNNTIDLQEFITATVNLGRLEREDNLFKTFAHFDKDGSGFITRTELQQALEQFPDATSNIDEILADIDHNGDGRVDYEEFCNMIRASGPELLKLASASAQLRSGILVDVPPDDAVNIAEAPATSAAAQPEAEAVVPASSAAALPGAEAVVPDSPAAPAAPEG